MSALYGLIHVDGRSAAATDLAAMARPLASWGPDGGGSWHEGGAGFGQLVAHRTPESVHEGGPMSVRGGTVVVVATGRLDNRHELCADLRVAASERSATPDGRLMAAAYEHWGEGAVGRLLGDWAFAAWDAGRRRLVLARDHYGQTGIYYHYDGKTFAFASGLKSLFALAHVPRRLNELRLAQHLVPWPVDGAATLYDGVHRLPPAHALTLQGTTLRTSEYWRPQDAPAVRLGSDDAYVERFVELFSEAVRARLRTTGTVASTLSAGLDSAAVTALAARELAQEGGGLTAYTSVPAFPEVVAAMPGHLVDEGSRARLVARAYPGIVHVLVPAADVTVSHAIEWALDIHDEPSWAVGNLPWIREVLEACRRQSAGVLLTGQMGNGGVSWAGAEAVVLGLLTRGNVREAWRALVERVRSPGIGWRLALRRELAGPLRRRVGSEIERRRRSRDANLIGPLIAPAFARRLDLTQRLRDAGFDPTFARATDDERRVATLLPGVTPGGAIYQELGTAYGLDVRDPTADVRLLEFCFGVPADQFVRGDHDRWLMRRGLGGLVPTEVRWNRTRGMQGADIAYRLRADEAAVNAALERISTSEAASYLSVRALRYRWDVVRRDASARSMVPGFELARALSIGRLLERFEN